MAIKQRLLEKLERIAMGLNRPAFAKNQRLIKGSVRRLTEARDLCRKGIAKARYTAYEDIYDTLLLAMTQSDVLSQEDTLALCRELMQSLISETRQENFFKKEIVFLPYQASMWDSLESVWRAAAEDTERAITYVVPIPYAELNPDHTVAAWHCQAGLFPEYVPILGWQDIDLEEMHPDAIFVHNPYDDRNVVTSVDNRYYAQELTKNTNVLVYIPYYVSADNKAGDYAFEDHMAPYVMVPAVLIADLTIVQSEDMRQIYLNVLNQESQMKEKDFWVERIKGLGSPKTDKVLRSRKEDFCLPSAWEKLVKGRKVVLYNTSVGELIQYADKVCERLRYVFSLFRHRQDIALWWRVHPLTRGTIKSMLPQLEEEYLQLEQEYRREGWGIYDESPELHRAICWSDAYYGVNSSVLYLYQDTGKPMLLQDAAMLPSYVPFWMFDAVIDFERQKFWFQAPVTNAVLSMELLTGALHIEHVFSDQPFISRTEWTYSRIFRIGEKLLFAPLMADQLMEYDMASREEHIVQLPAISGIGKAVSPRFYGGACRGESIFLFGRFPAIVEYDVKKREVRYYLLPEDLAALRSDVSSHYRPHIEHQGKLWFVPNQSHIIVSFDYESKAIHSYTVGDVDNQYLHVASDGEYLWLYDMSAQLVQWDPVTDECAFYPLPQGLAGDSFAGMLCNGSLLLLFSRFGCSGIYGVSFHTKTKEIHFLVDEKGKDSGYLWAKALENQHVLAYEPYRGEFHEYDASGSLCASYALHVGQELFALWRTSLLGVPKKILREREMMDLETFLNSVIEGEQIHQDEGEMSQKKTIGERIWETVLDYCCEKG